MTSEVVVKARNRPVKIVVSKPGFEDVQVIKAGTEAVWQLWGDTTLKISETDDDLTQGDATDPVA